jgi:uncharacterized OB-fold protein
MSASYAHFERIKGERMTEAVAKKRMPLRRGRFVIPDDPSKQPYLIAARCKSCGKYFEPRREICLNCGKQMMEVVPLKGKGKVYSFTAVWQQLPGAIVKVPYAIVIVSMPEGYQVHGVVTEDYDKLQVDQPVEIYFEKVPDDVAKRVFYGDLTGVELLVDKFRIVKSGGK